MREEFSPGEGEILVRLPYAVSMTVMMAAPTVPGARGETKAMVQGPAGLAVGAGTPLVGLLAAGMQARAKDPVREQQAAWTGDPAGYRATALEVWRSAGTALAKVSPDEARAHGRWVLAVGTRLAEASRERRVAVSEPELAVLAEITGAPGPGTP